MKKIEAIIRKTKFHDVAKALKEEHIDFFSFWDVRGTGNEYQERAYRGIIYDTSTIERTKISIIVRDQNVDNTIKTILRAAKTGAVGDGKIFVLDIEQSYRIRTEESGDKSLYNTDETPA